jgi:hypothetical protein
MNQHDFSALPLPKVFDQPIIETTDFEDRDELRIHLAELSKKHRELLGTRTYLTAQHRVSVFVANTNRDLLGVLVNGEVQHLKVLLCLWRALGSPCE